MLYFSQNQKISAQDLLFYIGDKIFINFYSTKKDTKMDTRNLNKYHKENSKETTKSAFRGKLRQFRH